MHFLTKHLLVYEEAQCESRDRNLLVKSQGKSHTGHTAVGACHTPPAQVDEVDKAVYKYLPRATQPPASVLNRGFNHVSSTALSKQSRIFLECVGDTFSMQMPERPNKGNTLRDLCA